MTQRNPNQAERVACAGNSIAKAIARPLSTALLCLSVIGATGAAEPAASDLSRFNLVVETAPAARKRLP